jgi:hypothetical protein
MGFLVGFLGMVAFAFKPSDHLTFASGMKTKKSNPGKGLNRYGFRRALWVGK